MLKWKQTEEKKITWHEAKSLEIDSWRLPTRGELIDAYDNKIKGFETNYYWSSTMYGDNTNGAWYVNLGNGSLNFNLKKLKNFVRLCKEI